MSQMLKQPVKIIAMQGDGIGPEITRAADGVIVESPIRKPEMFDVIVTANMFGDIISDEASELSGGLGLAAVADAIDRVVDDALENSATRTVDLGRALGTKAFAEVLAGGIL